MDEYIYDAIDLLKCMIKIPSVSREEQAVATLLHERCLQWNLEVQRVGNNIICNDTRYDESRPTLLLNSHIDTVRPAEGWTRNPYIPEEDDGRIYGLGSNDAGASVVSLLAAFRRLIDEPRHCNILMVASCEEEVSGKGGLESVLPHLPRIDAAIVGEPTGMQPAIAEKGLMVLDGEVHGIAGHAARNEGVNAIYKALPVIDALRNFKCNRESEMLGPVKVSVTQINSGTAHNVVPDVCRFVVDVRTTDAYTNVETLELLRQAAGEECTLTARSTRLNPSHIAITHPLVQRATMLGLKPFGSPTLSDQALMPFPSMKIGPGQSSRSHSADEFIAEQEIREAISIYNVLLSGIKLAN